jgi:hypothetical protein
VVGADRMAVAADSMAVGGEAFTEVAEAEAPVEAVSVAAGLAM